MQEKRDALLALVPPGPPQIRGMGVICFLEHDSDYYVFEEQSGEYNLRALTKFLNAIISYNTIRIIIYSENNRGNTSEMSVF